MSEPKTDGPGRGKRGKALIYLVDDEPMLLELASVILEPVGYALETFSLPESALRAFAVAEPPPALIITDHTMPAMTGLELVAACRRIRPQQKALLLTGTVGPEIFDTAPVKPDRLLAKPFQAKQLLDVVSALLADEPG